MDKFLIFIDAADDAAMFPVSGLLGMTVAADATILINFVNTLGPNATEDKRSFVTLTCTADKELEVFKALAKAIADIGSFNSDKFLVVCDDVNSVFAHSDILSCTISLDA
tara:strand:- start:856 stop:1185 length:330 start_codon:yes stop_codon:yes gene_type:complete